MKSALIRIFAVMTLVFSISAFAQQEKDPAADKNCKCMNGESTSAPSPRPAGKPDSDQRQSDNDQGKSEKQMQIDKQMQIEKQNRQWLHDLQGIYGG